MSVTKICLLSVVFAICCLTVFNATQSDGLRAAVRTRSPFSAHRGVNRQQWRTTNGDRFMSTFASIAPSFDGPVVGDTRTEAEDYQRVKEEDEKLEKMIKDRQVDGLRTCLDNSITNRYQVLPSSDNSFLLQAEKTLADYFNMKYGLGVCSGGMAIMLGLRGIKRSLIGEEVPDDQIRVYSNAFTFNAVPSAIVNAGFQPVLIESTPELTMDLDDLEVQLKEDANNGYAGKGILALSYMRGRIPDMDKVLSLCKKYDMKLLEDNAHGYGCEWKGRKIGSFGDVSIISTQASKLIDTGEGGLVFTNDPGIMAFTMFSAGCYESLYAKHGEDMTPPKEAVDKFRFTTPNYSCRMTNFQGAMVLEQMKALQNRVDAHNHWYSVLQKNVENSDLLSPEQKRNIHFIPQLSDVGPVYDSVQIRILEDGKVSEQQDVKIDTFVQAMKNHSNGKFSVQKFLDIENARYYKSWQTFNINRDLPKTDQALANVVDARMSHKESYESMQLLADTIAKAYLDAFVV